MHAFAGHIACDANSESEIVLPLMRDGEVLGAHDLRAVRLPAPVWAHHDVVVQ